jgi:hypothetical protein
LIPVELTPSELSTPIEALEAEAMRFDRDAAPVDAVDTLFLSTAEPREAFR